MTVPTTTLSVTFVSESAGYDNTFGWYNSQTGMGGILFADVEAESRHAPLTPGVSTVNFTVNTADLPYIQFFLIPNGYNTNRGDADDLTGPIKVIQLSDGSWAVADVDSSGNVITKHGKPDILQGAGANALFTETSKNAGHVDYASSVVGSNQTAAALAGDTADGPTGLLAWEDLAATRNKRGTYGNPGDADYNDAVFQISIVGDNGGNHAPVANADSVSVSEDAAATTINVLANDTDPDAGNTLHVASVATAGVLGTVTIAPDGQSIVYTPAASFRELAAGETATETLSYTVADQDGATSNASVTVTVTGANDAPLISAAVQGSGNEGAGTFNVNLLQNASDIDHGAVLHVANLVWSEVPGLLPAGFTLSPDGNSISVDTNSLAYDAMASGETFTTHFSYDVVDEHGALVHQTATITINGANDAPQAGADQFVLALEDDAAFTIDLLAGASDVDHGAVLHAVNINPSVSPGVTVLGDTLTFDPGSAAFQQLAQGEQQVITVAYDIQDEFGAYSDTHKSAQITVTGVNDAATITGTATGSVVEAGGVNNGTPGIPAASGALTVHDVDNGQAAFQTPASLVGTYGTFAFNAVTGVWGYTLNDGAANVQALSNTSVVHDTLTVTSLDGTATQVIDVTIQGANDNPTVTGAVTGSVTEDTPPQLAARGNLILNDPDGGTPAWSIVGGSASPQTQDFQFRVDNLKIVKNGLTFFEDTFGDGNPPPSAPNIGPNPTSYTTNGVFTEAAGRAFFNGTQAVALGTVGYGVRALLNTDTHDSSDPRGLKSNSDFTTEARFDLITPEDGGDAYGVRLTDTANGLSSDSIAELVVLRDGLGVHVVLREVNIGASTIATLQSIDLTIPPQSQIVLRLSYDHNSYVNSTVGGSVTASFDVVNGATGALISTTSFTNQATIFKGEDFTQVQLVGQTGLLETTPVYKLAGTYGTLTLAQDGQWHYFLADQQLNVQQLAQGQQVTDNFTVQVSDGNGGVTTKPVSITVNGVNDLAVIGNPTVVDVTEDTNVDGAGNLTASGVIPISDIDLGSTPAFQTTVTPGAFAIGTLTLAANGSYTYSVANSAVQFLPAGGTKIEDFTVTSTDGVSKHVTFTIHGVDDAPVAQPDNADVFEEGTELSSDQWHRGEPIAGSNPVMNDIDADHDILTVTGFVAGTTNATLVNDIYTPITGTYGTMVFEPWSGFYHYELDNHNPATNALTAGQIVTDVFTYTVTDGNSYSNSTITITITGANDAPVLDQPLRVEAIEGTGLHRFDLLAGTTDAEGDAIHVQIPPEGFLQSFLTLDADGHTLIFDSDEWQLTNLAAGEFMTIGIPYDLVDSHGSVSHQFGILGINGSDVASGNEFVANTYTPNSQSSPSVAALTGGGFVLSWTSVGQDGDGGGVYAQRYNADGTLAGSEFRVNSFTPHYQMSPTVTGLANGGFVISWTSEQQDGGGAINGSDRGVYAQLYDASGATVGGEFKVNTYIHGPQELSATAALNDGGFIITWSSYGQDGSVGGEPWSIYGQRYAANGSAVGSEFHINTYTQDNQTLESVTGLANGGFVVTWASNGQDGSGFGIYGQIYNASASPVGNEFRINSSTAGNQTFPTVAGLTDGGFIVTWTGQEGTGKAIYAQRYDSAGVAVNGEFRVNDYTAGDQQSQSVTGLDDGGFMVMWSSFGQDGDGWGVYGRRYDAAGNPMGVDFLINHTTAGDQIVDGQAGKPALDQLTNGDVVVGWYGPGSGLDSYASILGLDAKYDTLTVHDGYTFDLNVPHAGAVQFEGPTGTLKFATTDFTGAVDNFASANDQYLDFSAITHGNATIVGAISGPDLAAHSIGWVTSGNDTTVYVNASDHVETIATASDMTVLLHNVLQLNNNDFLI